MQEIDVEQIMARIQENIRQPRPDVPPSGANCSPPTDQLATDLASLHRCYDIQHLHFTSHRKVLGPFVVFVKRVLQRLLTLVLERQLAYNAANTRITTFLWKQVDNLSQQQVTALQTVRAELAAQLEEGQRQQVTALQTVRAELVAQAQGLGHQLETGFLERDARLGGLEQLANEMRHSMAALESTLSKRDARVVDLEKLVLQLKTNLILQERRITILLEEARKRLPDPFDQEQIQVMVNESKHDLDALYVYFEDQFRGTREEIKERFRVYLPILKEARLGSDRMPILDVGCGRGEWLELLKEEGLLAHGVDLNRVLVEQCRRRGFEVVEADALSYLRGLPDTSLGVVTGFHIVEHFPFETVIKLLDETVRVLKPGGLAIFETPNPENVLVGSYSFYLDPTHRNPIPSATLTFIAEARGLCRVEVMKLHPAPEADHVQEEYLQLARWFNAHFYGPRDYAVLGWKV